MNPAPRQCDRCGFKEGRTRHGKLLPETLQPLEQIGRTYWLCTQCRRKLSQYKPITH